jgi:hypothetical protein
MQCAQSDDRSRHAGLRPDPLTRKPRKGEHNRRSCSRTNASLIQMLPITIDMRDHMRQEKTGNLPSPLPEVPRQLNFAVGTLGLWGPDHFVIYYRNGRVPQPGIVILGNVTADVSVFDRPGPITVRVETVDP